MHAQLLVSSQFRAPLHCGSVTAVHLAICTLGSPAAAPQLAYLVPMEEDDFVPMTDEEMRTYHAIEAAAHTYAREALELGPLDNIRDSGRADEYDARLFGFKEGARWALHELPKHPA